MSYANGTTHYNLPQTLGTDKRDWFDTNQAFADVDAALYAAATGQAADAEAIVEINQKLVTDEENIASLQTLTSTHTSQISTLQTTVNSHTSQIADTRQDAEDMITAFNEGAAETSTHAYAIGDYFIYNDVLYKATAAIAIGDTIVPNTNCEATNVTTEISELNSDLSALSLEIYYYQDAEIDNSRCTINVQSKPYERVGVAFPNYVSNNGFKYTYGIPLVAVNSTQGTVAVRNYDGATVNGQTTDFLVILWKA